MYSCGNSEVYFLWYDYTSVSISLVFCNDPVAPEQLQSSEGTKDQKLFKDLSGRCNA